MDWMNNIMMTFVAKETTRSTLGKASDIEERNTTSRSTLRAARKKLSGRMLSMWWGVVVVVTMISFHELACDIYLFTVFILLYFMSVFNVLICWVWFSICLKNTWSMQWIINLSLFFFDLTELWWVFYRKLFVSYVIKSW